MIGNNFKISAVPIYTDVYCPKHRMKTMIELDDGFFNTVWWCKECAAPYELKLTKMRKWSQEAIDYKLAKLDHKEEK